MTIKIEATPHELIQIKEVFRSVDSVLSGGDCPSWRDVMYEVYEILAEAEICEEEPLIKNEKIRQIIKAWAKFNEVASVFIKVVKDPEEGYLYWELQGEEWEQSITICFGGKLPDTLEDMETYTIEELCGSLSDEEANER